MIVRHEDLRGIREKHAKDKIAYSGGVFDLFHVGHLDLLEHLAGLGDIVVVGVTPDDRVMARKGHRRPITPERQRAKIIDAIKYVDYVFIAPSHTPNLKIRGHKMLKDLRPDYFVFGEEHPAWFQDEAWLNKQGTQLVAIPRFSKLVSTTQIIERAAQSAMEPELHS